MHRRQVGTVVIAVLLTFVSASAVLAFKNPTQAPPGGNTPGVIWNATAGQSASFSITGTGKITGGAAFGSYAPDPAYAATTPSLYAGQLCLGAPAVCRTDWPAISSGDITSVTAGNGLSGGGASGDVKLDMGGGPGIIVAADNISLDTGLTDATYVNVSGDTMTGALFVNARATTQDLSVRGSSAFGGYALDPSYAVTTPSLYVGAPGAAGIVQFVDGALQVGGRGYLGNLTVYGEGRVNDRLYASKIFTGVQGGPALGYDITTSNIWIGGSTIASNLLTISSVKATTGLGAGGLEPTIGTGVNTRGTTYGIYAETTGPSGSSYAGYFVGDVFITGGLTAGGKKLADIAESVIVIGRAEPGDVMVAAGVGDDGLPRFARASKARDARVAGVISSDPTFTLAETAGRQPLAISGIVKVKAVGPITTGDLLVSSDAPGYASRCGDVSGCPGAVVGKALQDLKSGRGIILMMVMLR